MPRYTVITLVDITRTNPNRNETDNKKLAQQANFNSVVQAIGLRSNIEWDIDPIKHDGRFPHLFQGKGSYWIWEFEVEQEDIFLNENGPVGLLIADLHNVPIITGLDETVDIHPPAFQTHGSTVNIHIDIKV